MLSFATQLCINVSYIYEAQLQLGPLVPSYCHNFMARICPKLGFVQLIKSKPLISLLIRGFGWLKRTITPVSKKNLIYNDRIIIMHSESESKQKSSIIKKKKKSTKRLGIIHLKNP